GRWTVRQGLDADGDDGIDDATAGSTHDFGKGSDLSFSFAPGVTTVIELALDGAEVDVRDRPDLGLAPRDVVWRGGALDATIHSLGSRDAGAAKLVLEGADGRLLAEAAIPALAAPNDLKAKTAKVRITPPRGASLTGARLRVLFDGAEIALDNNSAAVPARTR
ncbi:MAG: LamG-like jellyroll fold domain-containing protein, partial [Brevundimonas sp.]